MYTRGVFFVHVHTPTVSKAFYVENSVRQEGESEGIVIETTKAADDEDEETEEQLEKVISMRTWRRRCFCLVISR